MTDICFSGGAKGADHAWGLMALDVGHELIHFTFAGHRSVDSANSKALTINELAEADPVLTQAAISIKRHWPSNSQHVNDLLRRNYFQIRWAERVYAVANIIEDSSQLHISGGTAWACQMYVDRWYSGKDLKECELYLFDMKTNAWMQWMETWIQIEKPPTPHGRYAAIGSRDITDAGINAIYNCYG